MRNLARACLLVSLLSTNAKPLEIENNFLFGTLIIAPLLLGCASTYYFEKRVRSIRTKRLEFVRNAFESDHNVDTKEIDKELRVLTCAQRRVRISEIYTLVMALMGSCYIAATRSVPNLPCKEGDAEDGVIVRKELSPPQLERSASLQFKQRAKSVHIQVPYLELRDLATQINDKKFWKALNDTRPALRASKSLSDIRRTRESISKSHSSISSEESEDSAFTPRQKSSFTLGLRHKLVGKIKRVLGEEIAPVSVLEIIKPYIDSIMNQREVKRIKAELFSRLQEQLGIGSRQKNKPLKNLIDSALKQQLKSLKSIRTKRRKRASSDTSQEADSLIMLDQIFRRDKKTLEQLKENPIHLQTLTKSIEKLRRHLVEFMIIEHWNDIEKENLIAAKQEEIAEIQRYMIEKEYISDVKSFRKIRSFYVEQLSDDVEGALQTLGDIGRLDETEFNF